MQLKGKNAAVSLYDGAVDNLIKEAFNHEIDISAEKVDGTRFLDTYQSEVPIYATWSVSIDAYFDPDDASFMSLEESARLAQSIEETVGAGAEIRLWLTESFYYGGDASVDLTITSSKDDLIKASISITGKGALNKETTGSRPTA